MEQILAFPTTHNPRTGTQQDGMTLRDYFAAQTLVGLITAAEEATKTEKIAQIAYAIADAMMEERKRT